MLSVLVGRRASWVILLLSLLASAAALAAAVQAVERDNATASVPSTAESALAAELEAKLDTAPFTPVFVVIEREGTALTSADRTAITELAQTGLAETGLALGVPEPRAVFADDGRAALITVPLASDIDEAELAEPVNAIRSAAATLESSGLSTHVTGGPAFQVDLANVFEGADFTLLATTATVVALLLLITYRSPWLWLVPLGVVGLADRVAAQALAAGTHLFGFAADGSTTGITSVLVFGAGTNYALLLIARYREELRRTDDRYDAMRDALRAAAPAILASSGTVILALICLGLASSPFSSSIGIGGAIGIAVAVAYALVVLPAALTVCGRGLFWPFVPKVGQATTVERGLWAKVGPFVTKRPIVIGGLGLVALLALTLPVLGAKVGLSQTEQFRAEPDSVVGQQVLAQHFPAGASQPTVVFAPDAVAPEVLSKLGSVPEVEVAGPTSSAEGWTQISAVLSTDPESPAAFELIATIRAELLPLSRSILVGGPDAQGYDAQQAAAHDQRLVIPLILGVVFVILLLVLRSLVAGVLLVLTVIASYAASMGAGWWASTHLFGFPALDLSVPLLSFLFLVALGIDYNIFLTTRAREEAAEHDSVTAINRALAVTGGVITSAGILLAAVFAVLGVLPLITLTQVGIIVGFGVLLDTLLVRSILVPALVALCGRWFWWPGRLARLTGQID